jgi:tyrosine-protein phosphatase YwqE
MIDWHCHLLPNLDDGAVTLDESIEMARSLADFGYTTVCCTPHCIKGYYDHSAQQIREATLKLQAELDNAEIHLQLRPGMEYMLDECFTQFADDLLPLGDTSLVLCEAPQQAHPEVVQECLELIIEKGFTPLIAHPERTGHFYEMLMRCDIRDAKCEVRDETCEVRGAKCEVRGERCEARDTTKCEERDAKCEETHQPDEEHKGFFSPLTSCFSLLKSTSYFSLLKNTSHLSLLSSFFSSLTSHFSLLKRTSRPAPVKDDSVFISQNQELLIKCAFQANRGSFSGFYGPQVQRRAFELLNRHVFAGLGTDLHGSASASKILQRDNINTNPLLKKLADWDGAVWNGLIKVDTKSV